MNWQYISGFFDADGSVSLATPSRGHKHLKVCFHNNELSIINSIKEFIDSELGCSGYIRCKKSKKETHQDSYDLSYCYRFAVEICNKLNSLHPKKSHRIAIYNEIQEIIPRNGHYTEKLLSKRLELEEKFWKH